MKAKNENSEECLYSKKIGGMCYSHITLNHLFIFFVSAVQANNGADID